jgi:isopentenyl diphosphate isomerase/L-lactate dehydrogenase-like FMN-dependent dehydrogenase
MTLVNLREYARQAQDVLPHNVWEFIDGGSEDELTLAANEAAFRRLRLRPRVLVDVSTCSLRTSVLGKLVSLPVLVAPLGCQRLIHPDGECATARAAHAAGSLMVLSTMSTTSLEAVAAEGGNLWFQLYVYRDRAITADLVKRATAAVYNALVVTVDAPRMGRRERDIRSRFNLPPGLSFANFVG